MTAFPYLVLIQKLFLKSFPIIVYAKLQTAGFFLSLGNFISNTMIFQFWFLRTLFNFFTTLCKTLDPHPMLRPDRPWLRSSCPSLNLFIKMMIHVIYIFIYWFYWNSFFYMSPIADYVKLWILWASCSHGPQYLCFYKS